MTANTTGLLTRSEFRSHIRQLRNQLTPREQSQQAAMLLDTLITLPEWQQADTIALYLSFDGEIDTKGLIEWCWQHNKKVCLPVLHPFSKGQLLFIHYHPNSPMTLNRYNIEEPQLRQPDIVPVHSIDLIMTPLVGFDKQGHRIGMGGGYYDRTLAPFQSSDSGPNAIGLAHHCQQVDTLPIEHWDIPLPIIVTPSKIWRW